MDLVPLAFLGLMVVVGGLVAFIADRLGRNLGKKRLTLLGMRPRHTAAVLTVLAGMLIPLITVLAVSGVSSDVRVWLAEGQRAIHQRDDAIRARNEAAQEVRTLTGEKVGLEARNARLRSENETKRTELDKIAKQVQRQQDLLADYEKRVRASTSRIAELSGEVRSAAQQLASTNAGLIASKKDLRQVNAAREILATSYRKIKEQIDAQYTKNIDLTRQNDQLLASLDGLKKEKSVLETDISAIRTDLLANRQQLETTKLDLDRAQGELVAARDEYDRISRVLSLTRQGQMVIAAGQELSRVEVPAGVTAEQARKALASLVTRASSVARARGAEPLQGGNLAAGLVPRVGDDGKLISVPDQEQRLIKSIVESKTHLVLIATSLANSVRGEPAPLDIRPYRNPLVYKAGQAIAESRINGGESEDSILRQITDFLQQQVTSKALEANMIPVAGSDEPLGKVDSEEILQLVKSIRSQDRPVRLVALAMSDTRAADRLRLEFKIR